MKLAISGSRRTTSSASLRMRAHTGSTLASALTLFVRNWAMTPAPRDLPFSIARPGQVETLSRAGILTRLPELPEELENRGREAVVAVARNHVPGAGHVHVFRVRDEFQELPDMRLAHQFRGGP